QPLEPDEDLDNDGLTNSQELNISLEGSSEIVHYNSHPLLNDTDGDGFSDKEEIEKANQLQDKTRNYDPLSWNVTPRDVIMFTELTYRTDDYVKKVLDETSELTDLHNNYAEYKMMHNELSPYWRLVDSFDDPNGFHAKLYAFGTQDLPFLK
ncbi:hypothetical protein, partial [Mesomycoplasma ovipneumoniae]|uniref:hypothetical protein n=1 Tax=Mesomycoplasma ovipneumoniae TaxID=29562 RepID=UPI003080A92F